MKEAIIFCGIQATGKTTFYQCNFLKTHIRISLDLLKTRNREKQFLNLCIESNQPFVIDNTNITQKDREVYISLLRKNQFKIIGYYFCSNLEQAILRNNRRKGKELIPEIGIRGTYKKLEIPKKEEGFDELYYVQIDKNNNFIIKEWNNEI